MKKANQLMTFGQAIELAKQGIPVSAQGWDFIDRLTACTSATMLVPVDEIWSPENRRIGALLGQKEVPVKPYFTKMTRQGIENYIPTNEDMFDLWMVSEAYLHCTSITADYDFLHRSIDMSFALMTDEHVINGNLPFTQLYRQKMIGYHDNVYFVAGSEAPNKLNATIFNTLVQHANNRMNDRTFDGFVTDVDFYQDGWLGYCDGIAGAKYNLIVIDERNFDIDTMIPTHQAVNVILDAGSLMDISLPTGDTALDFITAQLIRMSHDNQHVNWVEFDLGDELTASAALDEGAE